MVLSVKNKIRFGTLFLFLLLVLTGGAGIFFTAILKHETRATLEDNYASVDYCQTMQRQLDSMKIDLATSIGCFETALQQQEGNITEPGEKEATASLRSYFNMLRAGDTTSRNILALRNAVQKVYTINMNAILHKSDKAKKTAGDAQSIIIALVVIIFIIAFTFSLNFPSVVSAPIAHLSEGITAISNKNYKHRIRIDNKDEFGSLAAAFNAMAERLEYFENSSLNKIMFEKSRAEAVINSLKDASIGIDKDNKILFANYQALQFLGLKASDIVGRSADEVSKQNDLFSFLVNNESSAPFKIVVDNRENYFIKETVDVPQGESKSKVIMLRNITSFKEMDVAKTNFIATISHELKTPLAASDLSLKLLEDERIGTLSADQKELIQSLKQDNQRVLKILSELLDMSRVEAGKIELDVQLVNPYLIVDHAIDTVTVSAKEKNIEVKKMLDEGLPSVRADAEKSTWVLNNFLTNAIKNSSNDSIITVHAHQLDNTVQFSVEDHGPGIAQEYLPRIFERYFKVPGSKAKGTGLGLGISKEFIEAQKGKIWVSSELGKGATFSFSLPAQIRQNET